MSEIRAASAALTNPKLYIIDPDPVRALVFEYVNTIEIESFLKSLISDPVAANTPLAL